MVAPTGAPAERYKRRVETRAPATKASRAKTWATVGILLAGIAGLLLWIEPWNSSPLEITSVQNERVDLVQLPGADGCFWRFDIEIANNADEQVWITSVELFLGGRPMRPEDSYGFIAPGVTSAIPIDLFLGDPDPDGRCPTAAALDHSPLDIVHATTSDIFTATASF